MLILHPREVSFLGAPWRGVTAVTVDRAATRVLAEHGDDGPHVTFADVPEQRATIRVTMDIAEDTISAPDLGVVGALEFATAPTGVNAVRHRVTARAVVTAVSHELSLRKGAVRTIELTGVSDSGAADPVTITQIGGAA